MTSIRTVAAALLSLATVTNAVSADTFKLYGTKTQLVRYNQMSVKGTIARGWSQFRKDKAYFGAMAANPTSDDYFFVKNFHSLETATAFAISGLADWGFNWGRPDGAEARGGAIATCEAASDRAIADFSNENRKTIARRSLNKCHVVHVSGPK